MATSIVVAVAGLVALAAYASEVILLLFAALLFAVFLTGLTDLIRRTGLSRHWALSLACVGLFLLLIAAVAVLVPIVANGIEELQKTLPQTLGQAKQRALAHPMGEEAFSLAQRVPLGPSKQLAQRMALFAGSSIGALGSLVVVLFIGLYLATEPGLYRRGLLRLLPVAKRKVGEEILDELQHSLWWWLIGKFIGMAVVGTLATIGLLLLRVPMAPVWGVLAGLLEFIPNIGPILSAVPAVLFAFATGPSQALYVVILYLALQTLQSYVIEPKIQRRLVSLPPALLLFCQVLFGMLFGFLGLLLATPLTVALLVLVRKGYVENGLEKGAVPN